MHFSRLRLSGFKSFVDPTDFRIEAGLTGVVGPNGCGKSNLLEALRWVMGANSAKAMRGEGMDDVIFAGADGRPSRNHAEVTLTIDNADHDAPARFNADPILEVARRIDRGEGSTFRVNGVEARARDVQLLFADASTGANSPALVRQGQISELIAAKPQNRRRILEEAAGVSGLHGRRHEAELKVRGAQANLERLDDLARELDANLARLKREARAAARYKALAAETRALRAQVLYVRWLEAATALERTAAEAASAGDLAETTARRAAIAATAALDAQAAIGPRREEETAAAAVLHRLDIEKDRLDHVLESAAAEAGRLTGEIVRIEADAAREDRAALDAQGALARLTADVGEAQEAIARAPERLPQLEATSGATEAARAEAEAAVEALAAAVFAGQAEARAALARIEESEGRLARARRALAQAAGERETLGDHAPSGSAQAAAALSAAVAEREGARQALDAAEAAREAAAGTERAALAAARTAADVLAARVVEARGLASLAGAHAEGFASVLAAVSPEAGLEAALAAALGDDLAAALDPRAPTFWAGAEASPPAWPEGATPLAPLIDAPRELAARLAFTALVARADGERLRRAVVPGARLVSREGDLWRWDGFTVRAEAPRPAQARLEQKARLVAALAEIEVLEPAATAAASGHAAAAGRLAESEDALRRAREAPRHAEARVAAAREAVERLERDGAARDARAISLDETIARFAAERDEIEAEVAAARSQSAAAGPDEDLAARLAAAREAAGAAREASAAARAALDVERHGRDGRERRLEALHADAADWSRRAQAAVARQGELAAERGAADLALASARAAPGEIDARRIRLLDDLAAAQARKAASGDALSAAEDARNDADRAARTADAAAADAREARATVAARLEAAGERATQNALDVTEATGLTPIALGEAIAQDDTIALPAEAGAADARLAALERDRDALGAVNLRAEADAAELAERVAELATERDDLAGALGRLRAAIDELNAEGRERLTAAFEVIDGHFRALFTTLFQGGAAELRLVESPDPLEAGLEIFACPPGKRMAVMSLMSGGEQALTAVALIFAVFLANPAPICVLDEVDAPLDDANIARFCDLLDEMRRRASTRFLAITHNPLTMSRMDRLYGVTMRERGVSQLVSVDLRAAEAMAAQ